MGLDLAPTPVSLGLYCSVVPFSDTACSVRTDIAGNVLPVLGIPASGTPPLPSGVWTPVNEVVTTSPATNSAVVSCIIGLDFYDMVYLNANSPSF